jgi:hypothetical protein
VKSIRFLVLLAVMAGLLTVHATPAKALGIFAQWQNSVDMDGGYGLGLKHNFSIVPIFGLEGRVSYLRYSEAGNYPAMNAIPLEAFGRLKLGLFYGGLGLGYYIFSGDDYPPKNSVGGFVAAGAEFTLLGLGGFAELRYLYLDPKEEDIIGGNRDLKGFGANLGVLIPIG